MLMSLINILELQLPFRPCIMVEEGKLQDKITIEKNMVKAYIYPQ